MSTATGEYSALHEQVYLILLLLQAVWSARKRTVMTREMSDGATAIGMGLGEEPATTLLSPL